METTEAGVAGNSEPRRTDLWTLAWWTAGPLARPDRAPTFEVAVLAILVLWNVTANLAVPDALEVPASLLGAAALLVVARRAGLSWAAVGLAGDTVRRGVRVGSVAALVVAGATALLVLIPGSREFFADDRFVGMGAAEVLYDALVRIPIGTALGEEIAFRGVLLGLLLLWMSPWRATLVAAALFGLWHILPGLNALDTAAVDVGDSAAIEGGAVFGQVLVTAAAGVAFSWLRFRGRHLAAPMLAHWALNGAALVAGWLVVQNGWA